jgi:phosphoribosylformylglycinamidine synthase PurS subunit
LLAFGAVSNRWASENFQKPAMGLSHPSPSIPLPVEGRGKEAAAADSLCHQFQLAFPHDVKNDLPGFRSCRMKAKIIITPKKAVLDPQGKTVQNALEHMGYSGIGAVHVGKYLEIEVTGDKETLRKQIDEACHKFLSNPVIEDYRLEIE